VFICSRPDNFIRLAGRFHRHILRGNLDQVEPGRRAKKVKLFCIVTIIFLLSLVTVAQYSSLVILNYRLSSARIELAAILDSSRTLELEVARLSSVGRIDQIAREELGMVDPEIEQLRVLTVGQIGDNRLGE
jgi:cell division protein FtsL